jgi:predicted ATPase
VRAAGGTRSEVAADLWAAVEGGLIHPIGGAHRCAGADPPGDVEYAFVHPRAHAAALARISPELQRELRRRAGERLLAEGAPMDRSAAIFDLAVALAPEDGAEANVEVARIELAAAERARRCNAFAAATRYLRAGISLLPGNAWEEARPLAFALHRDHAECSYLEGRIAEAEAEIDGLHARALSSAERASIDILHVMLVAGRGDFAGAVRLGGAALAQRGITLPDREGATAALASEAEAVRLALAGRSIEGLLDAPVTSDPDERAVLELLGHTLLAASHGDPDRFRLAGALMVGRALRHGNAPFASFGYASCGLLSDFRTALGADLGCLALRLSERLDGPGIQATVRAYLAIFSVTVRRPLRESLPRWSRRTPRRWRRALTASPCSRPCSASSSGS